MVQAPRPNAGRREKSRENDLFFWGKKKLAKKNIFFLHISSSYAKILGETNFHAFFGTASVRSRSLDQPLVPGVFCNYYYYTLVFVRDTIACKMNISESVSCDFVQTILLGIGVCPGFATECRPRRKNYLVFF